MDSMVEAVTDVLEALSAPLLPPDLADGWSENARVAMFTFYEQALRQLTLGESVDLGDALRGLDHWGVSSGRLMDLAVEASRRAS